jgi:hypothetical protein
MKRVRSWAERGVFVVSVLALLATSAPKGWVVGATITGTASPAPSKALALTIESSHDVRIVAASVTATYKHANEAPCLEPFVAGMKRTCLLPPGKTFDRIEAFGPCSSGCSDPCSKPPPGAYAKVESNETDVSIDGDTKTMPASLPSHGKGFIASRFEVKASGASFIEAHMTLVARVGTLHLDETQTCDLDGASKHATCTFTVMDSALGAVHDVDVTVEATGYEACAAPGCPAPKTFHIDSVTVLP